MSIGSLGYLALVALLLAAFHVHSGLVWRRVVMLAGGVALLAGQATTPLPLLPTLAYVGFGFLAATVVSGRRSMVLRVVFCCILIGVFLVLKQYWFVPAMPPFAMLVTVGLSYILLRALHAVIEAGDTFTIEPRDLGAYLRYQINPFTLLSGPIDRYDNFVADDDRTTSVQLSFETVSSVLLRISFGTMKLLLLAPLAQYYHLALPRDLGAAGVAPAAALFILYVYWNFSGSMDVIIAAARLFGYHLPENFDRPWMASSFVDFWSRWHITLSNFLRDVVFFPLLKYFAGLGVGRGGLVAGTIVGTFLAFVLMGLWHGTTYMFLWLGVLLAVGVTVNRLWEMIVPPPGEGPAGAARRQLAGAGAWLYFGLAAVTVWPSVTDLSSYVSMLAPVFGPAGLLGVAATLAALVGWRLATDLIDRLPAPSATARSVATQAALAVNGAILFLLYRNIFEGISTFNYYANIT